MHVQQEQSPNAWSKSLFRGRHGHLARQTCHAYAQEDESVEPLLGVIAAHEQGLCAMFPCGVCAAGVNDCHGRTTSLYGLDCCPKGSPALYLSFKVWVA